MRKRNLVIGAAGVALGALAVKYMRRPPDVEWLRHAHELPHADRSRFAVIDGVRMHYQEAGDPSAPVIFLIHGFASSCIVWSRVLEHIARRGFRVIAPDMIGFGFSEKPQHGEYTIGWQAANLVKLMDQLGIESATLAGSSYGGAVAAFIALDHPGRVERLVLVDSIINNAACRQPLIRLTTAPVIGDLLTPLLLDSKLVIRKRLRRIYDETAEVSNQRLDEYHRPLRAANTHRSVLATARRWDASRVSLEAAFIQQTTLLVWGENDRDVPLRHGCFLRDTIPNARLFVLKNCGHLPQEEWPREFIEILTSFCREQLQAAPERTALVEPVDGERRAAEPVLRLVAGEK